MPADLVPHDAIPRLAAQVDPAMLEVLRYLKKAGFLLNSRNLSEQLTTTLERLTKLGLVDPGYEDQSHERPYLWTSNGNGSRVLSYLETSPSVQPLLTSKVTVLPRALTALGSLPEEEQLQVLLAVQDLQNHAPSSWPQDKVTRLSEAQPVYLLQVPPDLRAFIRVLDSGGVALFDIVREETLRLFLERQRATSEHQ